MYSRSPFSRTPFSRTYQTGNIVEILMILETIIEDKLHAKESANINTYVEIIINTGYKYTENIEVVYPYDILVTEKQNHRENVEVRAPPEVNFDTVQAHSTIVNIDATVELSVVTNPDILISKMPIITIIEDTLIAKEDILINMPFEITEWHIQNYHYKETLDIDMSFDIVILLRALNYIIKYHCVKGKIDDEFYIKAKINNKFYIKASAKGGCG